jgi:serine/threonine protein phosphatase 1
MMPRTIAVGDIHGCSDALASILAAIDPQPDDRIITLGDYVNRGDDSKSVLDMLIELSGRCRLVPILGNHEEQMLRALGDKAEFKWWMEFGGSVTLDSYGSSGQIELIPVEHFQFVQSCVPWFETNTHLFTHGNYDPILPLDQQVGKTLRWLSLRDSMPGPHISGKIAVVGHTPQAEILDLGHLICLDTGCAYGGKLMAMDMESGQIWQASTML